MAFQEPCPEICCVFVRLPHLVGPSVGHKVSSQTDGHLLCHTLVMGHPSLLFLALMATFTENRACFMQAANHPPINLISEKVAFQGVTRFDDRYRLPLGISVNMAAFSATLMAEVSFQPKILLPYLHLGLENEMAIQDVCSWLPFCPCLLGLRGRLPKCASSSQHMDTWCQPCLHGAGMDHHVSTCTLGWITRWPSRTYALVSIGIQDDGSAKAVTG